MNQAQLHYDNMEDVRERLENSIATSNAVTLYDGEDCFIIVTQRNNTTGDRNRWDFCVDFGTNKVRMLEPTEDEESFSNDNEVFRIIKNFLDGGSSREKRMNRPDYDSGEPIKITRKGIGSSRQSLMPRYNSEGKVWSDSGEEYVWERIRHKDGDTYHWDDINELYWNDNGDESDYLMITTDEGLPKDCTPIKNSYKIRSSNKTVVRQGPNLKTLDETPAEHIMKNLDAYKGYTRYDMEQLVLKPSGYTLYDGDNRKAVYKKDGAEDITLLFRNGELKDVKIASSRKPIKSSVANGGNEILVYLNHHGTPSKIYQWYDDFDYDNTFVYKGIDASGNPVELWFYKGKVDSIQYNGRRARFNNEGNAIRDNWSAEFDLDDKDYNRIKFSLRLSSNNTNSSYRKISAKKPIKSSLSDVNKALGFTDKDIEEDGRIHVTTDFGEFVVDYVNDEYIVSYDGEERTFTEYKDTVEEVVDLFNKLCNEEVEFFNKNINSSKSIKSGYYDTTEHPEGGGTCDNCHEEVMPGDGYESDFESSREMALEALIDAFKLGNINLYNYEERQRFIDFLDMEDEDELEDAISTICNMAFEGKGYQCPTCAQMNLGIAAKAWVEDNYETDDEIESSAIKNAKSEFGYDAHETMTFTEFKNFVRSVVEPVEIFDYKGAYFVVLNSEEECNKLQRKLDGTYGVGCTFYPLKDPNNEHHGKWQFMA